MPLNSELLDPLQSAVMESEEALLIIDSAGRIAVANSACGEILGYGPNELVGVMAPELVTEDAAQSLPGSIQGYLADPDAPYLEYRMVEGLKLDGSRVPVAIRLFPFLVGGRRQALISVVEMGAREGSDQALRDLGQVLKAAGNDSSMSAEKLERLLERSGDLLDVALAGLEESRAQGRDFLLSYLARQQGTYSRHLAKLFDVMPIPLWEADYSQLLPIFDAFRRQGITDLRPHLEANSEVADQAISSIRILRANDAAARLNENYAVPGLYRLEGMGQFHREAVLDRVAGFYGDLRTIESAIPAAGEEAGQIDLVLTAWADAKEDGQIDLTSVFSSAVDLQPFRQLEAERRTALDQFGRVFENSAAGIIIVSRPDEVIKLANRAFTDMLRYEDGGLDGVALSEITPGDELADSREYVDETLADEHGVVVFERPYLCKDGEVRWGRVSTRLRDGSEGEPREAVAVVTDVTDLRRETQVRKLVENDLERRNAELQEFAWTAAHDLSEPLRKIRTFGERLGESMKTGVDDRSWDYLTRMTSAAERMQGLIDGLLGYTDVTASGGLFERVDLESVARIVLSDLEIMIADCGAVVEVANLPMMNADPTQMRQLLQNLVSNSLKFRSTERTPVVRIEGIVSEDSLSFSVSDNGRGFAPEHGHRIFGMFARLLGRDEVDGHGMGLAIARKIVERHGGAITADSTLGVGTTVTAEFPFEIGQSASG